MTVDLNNLSLEENKLFNDISIDLKADFHALLDRLYNDIDCNIDWLVNSLFSRYHYLSNIFIDLCYLEFLKRTIKKRDIKCVIVRNRSQKSTFNNYCRTNKLDINVECPENFWLLIKYYLKPLVNIFQNILTSIYMIINRDRNRVIGDYNEEGIILFDTFILSSMISGDEYFDRYYGELMKNLPKKIKNNIYYSPTFIGRENISSHKVLNELTKNQFIFNFDYLKLSDYLFAITSPFRILRKRLVNYYFHGFKIDTILNNDIYTNLANPISFEGILNYLFFRRLKLSKVKIKLIFDWFENQAIDRGFNKGKNDYFPRTRSVGYEGFIVSNEFYFHHRPTKAEYLNGVIPDIIAVTGPGLCNDIRKYYNSMPVITAPAFRYNNISSVKKTNYHQEKDKFIILAALPISLEYAKDIIYMLNDVLGDKNNKIDRIIINYHPSLIINKIKYLIDIWEDRYEISKESFSTLIHKVDMVVSNSSSICVESLIYGIPVIIAGSKNGITQNPIPDSIPKCIWELCYTVDEFNFAVKKLLLTYDKNRRHKYNKIAKDIQQNYFKPVTKKSSIKFLEI